MPMSLSLSARRAWIEMPKIQPGTSTDHQSLSARRAWIEMVPLDPADIHRIVALRKESVDRNHKCRAPAFDRYGRSPQGERG